MYFEIDTLSFIQEAVIFYRIKVLCPLKKRRNK